MYILQDYDTTLDNIITKGIKIPNRTGVDALTLIGTSCRYRVDEYFPLSTKRKAFYGSIFAELLWMLSGSTNVNDLEAMKSRIWSSWRDKEFEARNGYSDGWLGPTYGWSFRNFGGNYDLCSRTDQNGFDQVSYLVEELRKNKYSRRALINLWDPNVMTTDKVRLPTCHYSFQVLVDDQDRMTGILAQRSGDWLPGVSTNIVFYSAFLYMIGQQTGLKPYELVHNVGSAHVYIDQLPAAKEYLERPEIDAPKLSLKPAKDIFSYTLENFTIEDYNPGKAIKVPIAI